MRFNDTLLPLAKMYGGLKISCPSSSSPWLIPHPFTQKSILGNKLPSFFTFRIPPAKKIIKSLK